MIGAAMTGASRNSQLIVQAWEAVRTKGLVAIDQYFAPEYVRHSDRSDYSLPELRSMLAVQAEAFPDLVTQTIDLVSQRDRVAYRWESVGTHLGMFKDIPPTGKRVRVGGINIARIQGVQIVEEWSSWSKASFLDALGVITIDGQDE